MIHQPTSTQVFKKLRKRNTHSHFIEKGLKGGIRFGQIDEDESPNVFTSVATMLLEAKNNDYYHYFFN